MVDQPSEGDTDMAVAEPLADLRVRGRAFHGGTLSLLHL